MKTLNDLSAFQLNKVQMNAITGGKTWTCTIIYPDGDIWTRTIKADDSYTVDDVQKIVAQQSEDIYVNATEILVVCI